jgi:hypothetical protein
MVGEQPDTVVVVQANTLRIAHVPGPDITPRISDARRAAAVVAAYILEARSR